MPLLIPLLLGVALISFIFKLDSVPSEEDKARERKKRGYNSWEEESWARMEMGREAWEKAEIEARRRKVSDFVARLATKRHLTDEDKHS